MGGPDLIRVMSGDGRQVEAALLEDDKSKLNSIAIDCRDVIV
jgi:hypothetical protein